MMDDVASIVKFCVSVRIVIGPLLSQHNHLARSTQHCSIFSAVEFCSGGGRILGWCGLLRNLHDLVDGCTMMAAPLSMILVVLASHRPLTDLPAYSSTIYLHARTTRIRLYQLQKQHYKQRLTRANIFALFRSQSDTIYYGLRCHCQNVIARRLCDEDISIRRGR